MKHLGPNHYICTRHTIVNCSLNKSELKKITAGPFVSAKKFHNNLFFLGVFCVLFCETRLSNALFFFSPTVVSLMRHKQRQSIYSITICILYYVAYNKVHNFFRLHFEIG